MRRHSILIMVVAAGLLAALCANAPAAPAREGADGPTASAPFVVVIDPAHGGRDAGSRGALVLEKNFTLRAAQLMAALLSRRPEVKVVLTRETDKEMTPVQRAAVANYNAASLFLSLHADASWRPGARGPLVVVAAPRRPPRVEGEPPQAVAFRWQRSQNVHLASNRRFALGLQRRFTAIRPGEKPPLRILAVRNLEGVQMPSVYLSLGVISTPEDEARLSEVGEEDPYVVAVVQEIWKFAGLPEEVPPPPAPQPETPGESETPEGDAAPVAQTPPGETD